MGLFAKAASLRDRITPAGPSEPKRTVPGGGLLRRIETELHAEPPQAVVPALPPPADVSVAPPPQVEEAEADDDEQESGPIVEWDADEEEPAPPQEATVPVQAFADRLAALTAEIMDTRAGIEAPGTLYAMLGLRLGIERGAILVPDDRGVFSPWAASALDKTTLRRLRLTAEEVAAITAGTVEGDGLAPYLRLFSSRDAASIAHLHLWPCPGPKASVALIVATDMEAALRDSDVFRSFLPGIMQALGQILQERREAKLGPARGTLAGSAAAAPGKVIDEALRHLPGASARAFLLRVSLAPVVEAVAAEIPTMDRFRLALDIGTVLGRLTRDTAVVTMGTSPQELLFLVHGTRNLDPELVLHTLLGSLRGVLPSMPAIDPQALEPRVRRFPEDGATAAELMAATG